MQLRGDKPIYAQSREELIELARLARVELSERAREVVDMDLLK